jgi:hypothetical protein
MKRRREGEGVDEIENPEKKRRKNHNECFGRSFEYILTTLYESKNECEIPSFKSIFKSTSVDISLFERDIKKIQKIKEYYPYLQYIGNKSHLYDFMDENSSYISVKTNFCGSKVCPQKIGQSTLSKFREYFELDESYNTLQIQSYIIEHIDHLLEKYIEHTFHCDIIYYQYKKKSSTLCIIPYDPEKIKKMIFEKEKLSFSHLEKSRAWNESTTLYYHESGKKYSIGEFQIHRHRDVIKFRWVFNSIFQLFDLHPHFIESN